MAFLTMKRFLAFLILSLSYFSAPVAAEEEGYWWRYSTMCFVASYAPNVKSQYPGRPFKKQIDDCLGPPQRSEQGYIFYFWWGTPSPCKEPQTWDEQTQTCVGDEPPPQSCGDDENTMPDGTCVAACPPNYGRINSTCLPLNNNQCTTGSTDFQGFVNGAPVCTGQSQCSSGQTPGYVGGGDQMNFVCIDPDYGPPTCDSNSVVMVDNSDGSGGLVCSSATPKVPTPGDADGDGIPDQSDPEGDHDGDGIANALDPDADSDGDGVPNGQDTDRFNPPNRDPTNPANSQDVANLGDKIDSLKAKVGEGNETLEGIKSEVTNIGEILNEEITVSDELTGAPTFNQTGERLIQGIKNAPAIAPIANMATGLNLNKMCPTASFEIFNKVYVMNAHCGIVADHRDFLRGVFIAVWVLSACVLFLRA